MEQPTVEIPSREHLREVWMQSQTVLGLAEDALKGDAEKRRIVLAAVDRLNALAEEREKEAALAEGRPLNVLRSGFSHFFLRIGWPDDLPLGSVLALQRIVPMITGQHPYGHHTWREAMADLREDTQRLGEIIGPHPAPKSSRYAMGPGRTVSCGGAAELSLQEFKIMQAIKERDSMPLGELMRPSHDDAVWKERFNQDDHAKIDKMKKAFSRLNAKFLDEGVKIELRISGVDLLVEYT